MSPDAALASALAIKTFRSGGGPFMHEPVAVMIGSVKPLMKSSASALAHQNGPPAITPTPLITEDHAVPNWTAINAPDDIPEIELSPMAAL